MELLTKLVSSITQLISSSVLLGNSLATRTAVRFTYNRTIDGELESVLNEVTVAYP